MTSKSGDGSRSLPLYCHQMINRQSSDMCIFCTFLMAEHNLSARRYYCLDVDNSEMQVAWLSSQNLATFRMPCQERALSGCQTYTRWLVIDLWAKLLLQELQCFSGCSRQFSSAGLTDTFLSAQIGLFLDPRCWRVWKKNSPSLFKLHMSLPVRRWMERHVHQKRASLLLIWPCNTRLDRVMHITTWRFAWSAELILMTWNVGVKSRRK